jgi:hypothetical protein
MKKIMINNEKDLLSFLEIVAKESVVKSLREVDDSDHNVALFKNQKKKDSNMFHTLKEEESAQPKGDYNQEDNEDDSDNLEKSDNDESLESEITPRKIISQINNIRAGHSLKNSDVKENLVTFLERLDNNELLVLFYYLEGIAKILNQTIKGSEAIDPSEDPLNIKMNRSDDSNDNQSNVRKSKPKNVVSPEEGEDTSPPIKVNESQNKEDIRRKIRILMS